MLSGLQEGLAQLDRYRDSRYVNHLILITDGRTYGDEEECLRLASEAQASGIGISGMGIGDDWNDRFLDELASRTGGSSAYISSAAAVPRFLQERVRNLAMAYAERTQMIVAPSLNTTLKEFTRTSPDALSIPFDVQPIPLGSLDGQSGLKTMLQLHLSTANAEPGEFFVGRVDVICNVLGSAQGVERVSTPLMVEVTDDIPEESPPGEMLEALSRLALYQLQDRAREALEEGDFAEATRKLEYLATRLLENGEEDLGQAALHEARHVAHTHRLTEEGIKELKYGTRALMPLLGDD
jgi:Ca-activated chloride channel family protein